MNTPDIIIFGPCIDDVVHIEGMLSYRSDICAEDDGPSDCFWIVPGTLDVNE